MKEQILFLNILVALHFALVYWDTQAIRKWIKQSKNTSFRWDLSSKNGTTIKIIEKPSLRESYGSGYDLLVNVGKFHLSTFMHNDLIANSEDARLVLRKEILRESQDMIDAELTKIFKKLDLKINKG